jgi:hypothetical protein
MRREANCTNLLNPVSEYVQHHNWPFPCTAVDGLLVCITKAITATGDSRTFVCTNSEGLGHSGLHWVACIVNKATRSSVANAMKDENDAETGLREGGMRNGDSEEGEIDGGEEPKEHSDDGEGKDEKEGEGRQDGGGGGEDKSAEGGEEVDDEEVDGHVDRGAGAGDH